MSYKDIGDWLFQQSTATQRANTMRPDLAIWPGDTFAPPQLSDLPVEVVVLGRDHSRGKYNAVLLDDYPQVGSHDVKLHEPGRVANIRLDREIALDASFLTSRTRTGFLSTKSMDEIQRKRRAVMAGIDSRSLNEEIVDGDPDYRRWKDETLGDALSLLKEHGSTEKITAVKRKPRRPWMPVLMQAAALAFLIVGATFSVRQMEAMRSQMDAQNQAFAEREREMQRSQDSLAERLAASDAELGRVRDEMLELEEVNKTLTRSDDLLSRLKRQIKILEPEAIEPNLPYAFLNFGTVTRSINRGIHRVEIPEASGRIALLIEVVDPEPYSHYGVELRDQASGELIWSYDAMQRDGSLLSVALPASLLLPGDYDLDLIGYDKETSTPLTEGYLLRVRRPGQR